MEVPALGRVGHVTGVQQQAQHFRLVQATVNVQIIHKIRNRKGLTKQQKKGLKLRYQGLACGKVKNVF
jgi:hypothetical protein